mgnify:FL=1
MEFNQFLQKIRTLTEEIFIPNEHLLEENKDVPESIMDEIKNSGLFAISIPAKYGGLDYNMEQQVLLTFEFTKASAVYRSKFSTTIGLCSQALLDFGTNKQKEMYLPGMAKGVIIGSFALTEPEAGSDAASIKTIAVKKNDFYILNGTKKFITNAPNADLFLVMARTDPKAKGSKGISSFLVDAKSEGIKVGKVPEMLGHRGSASPEVYFNNCKVKADSLLGGKEGGGLKPALRGINHARLHVAATCVGQAIRLIEESVKFSNSRIQFETPIAEMPAIQNMIADSYSEMLASKAMTLEAARKFDSGSIPETEIAAAKYFSSEMVSRVADRSLQIMGGAGYLEGNPITRLFRDTRLFRLYEGTSQIQQRNIARKIIKELE